MQSFIIIMNVQKVSLLMGVLGALVLTDRPAKAADPVGPITRLAGKCIDITSANTANGTTVQLFDCNGTGAQKWTVTAAHDIVNPQSNRCLDVTGNNSAN